jgi:hypothetical protein
MISVKSICVQFDRLKRGIYDFFTQNSENVSKIKSLSEKFFALQGDFRSGDLDRAMDHLRDLLIENARFQISTTIRSAEAREAYKEFSEQLEKVQCVYATRKKVKEWVETSSHSEKELTARYLLVDPAHLRFSASFDPVTVPPPYRFSEIPAGAVLIDEPAAFLKHKKMEGKQTFFQTLYLKIKAIFCRIFTGKPFTHMAFSMGDGKIFDLSRVKPYRWPWGQGHVKDFEDKMYYGMVRVPNQKKMLQAYNMRFPSDPCATFEELTEKMNERINIAADSGQILFHYFDTIKTIFTVKRPANYDPMTAWNDGDPRLSCSGVTSALLASFGIFLSDEFNKMDKNISPADFFRSKYFEDLYTFPH